MRADWVNPLQDSGGVTARCPQCGTISNDPTGEGRTTCRQCGHRFCSECYYYRHRLGTDFCLACGAQLTGTEPRPVPALPGYLDRHVTRSVSLINLWFLAWLALTLSGGPVWLSAAVCGTLSLYWLIHSWRFRYRTGLVQASRFIGGIGLSVILTMLALVVLQLWLIRPPMHWQSPNLWAFIVIAMLVVPSGILGLPAVLHSRLGIQIADEATTYATRWLALEQMRYRDTLLLRIPDVRHIPPVSSHQHGLARRQ